MSSESGEPARAPTPDQRLHPLSWLFVLIGQLRQFALPLLAGLFYGAKSRASQGDEYALIGVAVLTLISVAQYFTYRYRIDADGVTIRSGVFQRNLRHIPFARIQNVSLHQNLLHRFFGVAGEQDAALSISNPHHERIVVPCRGCRQVLRIR